MSNAWLCLTIAGKRQYGGNVGYKDDLQHTYRFDSFVPYCKQVRCGDQIMLRNRSEALGLAEIRRLEQGDGEKRRLRCPQCSTAQIKKRERRTPAWRCNSGHVFDVPTEESVACTEYAAHFEGSWLPVRDLGMNDIRAACPRFVGQNSIQPIDLIQLAEVLIRSNPEAEPFLGAHSSLDADGDPWSEPDSPDPLRQIRARRGQKAFRETLRACYRDQCVISGTTLPDLLEAAHLYPYRTRADNRRANGLLLRCDIHTLFDLDLIGIDPANREIHVNPNLRDHGYDHLVGRRLACGNAHPDGNALAFRWKRFQEKLSR